MSSFKVRKVVGNCVTALNVVSEKFAHVKIAVNKKQKDGTETATFVTLMWKGEKAVEQAKKLKIEKGNMIQVTDGDVELTKREKDGKEYHNLELTVNPYETNRVYFPPKEEGNTVPPKEEGNTDFNPDEY